MTAVAHRPAPALDSALPPSHVWLFSRSIDLWTFGGSAAAALVFLGVGRAMGWLESTTPEWTWVIGVLLVDVAHVYATGFRVYFLPEEFRRRPWLYGLTPLLSAGIGWAIASESETLFWRILAYLAVFHFIRQQSGWVAWYRARGHERDWPSACVDYAAVYGATLYPMVYWHTHLPRDFWWFLPGDFLALPAAMDELLWPIYVSLMTLYAARSAIAYASHRGNPGKDLVVVSTAVCWYLGIIAFNSDYAFTVTNVLIHGIPYLVLTYWYARRVGSPSWLPRSPGQAAVAFLSTVWILAYAEELLWDRMLWHDRDWLFGPGIELHEGRAICLALLATPQVTHYILDGFLWRQAGNPQLGAMLRAVPNTSAN